MTLRDYGLIVALLALLAGTLFGCRVWPDVPYWAMEGDWRPDSAVEVTPAPMWLNEYRNAEECSGLKGNAALVRWYIVPGNGFEGLTDEGQMLTFFGYATRGHIYIAETRKNFEWVIRHEALHDILEGGGHNITLFGVKCKAYAGYLE
jgi:hypothetical protein